VRIAAATIGGANVPRLLNAPATEPVPVRRVAEDVNRLLDGKARLEIGALPRRENEPDDAWPDDSLARSLGFRVETPLEEGLRTTLDWYRDNPWFREEAGS
jgi:nucleoside-diphosphate-sugar epimerase